MALTYFRPRGDIKSNWESANPVLKEREMGVEWETKIGSGKAKVKFGDGITAWNDLDYAVYDTDKLGLSGGTMTGAIDMNQNSIENVAEPVDEKDVANKKYVDGKTGIANESTPGIVKESEQITVEEDGTMALGKILDQYGIVGEAQSKQLLQDLINTISNKVMNELMSKTMMSNVHINSENNVPTSSLVYGMNETISELTSSINSGSLLFRGRFTGNFNDTSIQPGIYEIYGADSVQNIPKVNGQAFSLGLFTFIQFPTVYKTQLVCGRGILVRSYQGSPAAWIEWITSPV